LPDATAQANDSNADSAATADAGNSGITTGSENSLVIANVALGQHNAYSSGPTSGFTRLTHVNVALTALEAGYLILTSRDTVNAS